MKIALIRRRFSPTGGAELYLQRLLDGLLRQNHELHLFCELWQNPPPGTTLHTLPIPAGRAARPRAFAQAVQAAIDPSAFDVVFSLERTLQQDVYRAGDGVHRVWLRNRRRFAPWWKKPWIGWSRFHRGLLELERQTFSPARTGRVIVNAEMVRNEIIDEFGFPSERISLVRNGIELTRFQQGNRALTRRRFGVGENDFLLLFVGSGWERKGLGFLRTGFERLLADQQSGDPEARSRPVHSGQTVEAPRTIKLLVVGKGRIPGSSPEGMVFAGSMPDVEHAYAAADLFVFLPIYEPSANVCIEAMAAGLPVITTAQNGAAELIVDQVNGTVLSSPADVTGFVGAVRFWMSRRPAAAAGETSELAVERNVAETVQILEKAAAERHQ